MDAGLAVIRDGVVLCVNRGFARLARRKPDHLVGRHLDALFLEDDRAALVQALQTAVTVPETSPDPTDRENEAPERLPSVFRLRRLDRDTAVSVTMQMVRLTPIRPEDTETPMVLVALNNATRETEMAQALRDSEARYRGLFEHALEGIYQTTPTGQYITVNPAMARILGFERPEDLIAARDDIGQQTYLDPDVRHRFTDMIVTDGVVEHFEAQVLRKDGSVIWVTENARCVRDQNGEIVAYEGTMANITERKQADADLHLMAKVVNSVHEGIVIIDRDCLIWGANEAYQRMTGYDAADLLSRPARLTTPELHEPDFEAAILEEVERSGHWVGEVWGQRRNAPPFPMEMSVSAVRDRKGDLTHYVSACTDITKRKRDEEHIRFQANYDMLTHLPNRYLIMDRLEQAILKARRDGTRVCVLFLDLDRFKNINDLYGHAAGDEILKLVARRLRQVVRMSDTVGRLAGDEFIVALTDVASGDIGDQVAEKIIEVLSEAFLILDAELFCLPSIGVTYFPDQADTVEELLRNADIAMYHAKHMGDRRFVAYSEDMAQRSIEMMNLENDLRHALNRNELELHYQPKVAGSRHHVVGVEALIRWRHPRRGLVGPGEFVPLAEDSGLIIPIGRWTLATACEQYMRWRAQGIAPPSISVNVSMRQFTDSSLLESVREVLDRTGVPAGCLDLEITESVMTGDVERAVATLNALKALGVTLSIDDFGTGYSSLNYLKTFPIDTLKIDQTFVRDVSHDTKDAAIVTTIVTLARNLGFNVVAEGVESQEQLDFLLASDCGLFQGYFVSRPLAAADFTLFLQTCQTDRQHAQA
ncbi:sensor domain-containing protein [Roseospira marina]|nr:bifunctional diguanylate cyclase/phosphodiesterase [Roseospira marina]MBB4312358.1 diguanylate cyclase (GGDEF)-like protein/PAS domain S-box-containing protein [Roseospira marina]MBB5085626.1 diguanylate cyclase (GGDEF)-like protein/PAS domain S-box-containing protein [Roseospira marina]